MTRPFWTLLVLLYVRAAFASVEIAPNRSSFSWKAEWSKSLYEELTKEEYRQGENSLLNIAVADEDLKELECSGYNRATLEEKADFWVVFFSSLARAESGFNQKARSRLSRGHRSYGLLQLNKSTARSRCGVENVKDPEENLICGVKLMSWQLQGAPLTSGRLLRSDLKGQIFGKNMFQWGPLRKEDKRGRTLLVSWFKKHIKNLDFCSK